VLPFRQFITENLKSLQDTLDDIGVDHSISQNKNVMSISKIVVSKEKRNQGIGTRSMKAITNHADKHNLKVTLTPSSDFGGTKSRLVKFYKNHGFIENKGKNKDFSTRDTMYREPK
jgi:predicted GNAT family N-acyltransferase